MSEKKPLILHVLNYLTAYSSEAWPVTQTEMARELSEAYHSCDRKTVGRNIRILCDLGYPIVRTPKGYYMARRFSMDEIIYVREAILASTGKGEAERTSLADRIESALTKMIRGGKG